MGSTRILMRHCVMSILPLILLATYLNTHVQAAPNQLFVIKRGFRPSLLDWRLHVSPYFETAKRVRPLTVQQPTQTESPKISPRDLDTVLQENMDLAEEILSDLNSMFRDDRRPGRGARMLQQDLEIDSDDPKRLLRIS